MSKSKLDLKKAVYLNPYINKGWTECGSAKLCDEYETIKNELKNDIRNNYSNLLICTLDDKVIFSLLEIFECIEQSISCVKIGNEVVKSGEHEAQLFKILKFFFGSEISIRNDDDHYFKEAVVAKGYIVKLEVFKPLEEFLVFVFARVKESYIAVYNNISINCKPKYFIDNIIRDIDEHFFKDFNLSKYPWNLIKIKKKIDEYGNAEDKFLEFCRIITALVFVSVSSIGISQTCLERTIRERDIKELLKVLNKIPETIDKLIELPESVLNEWVAVPDEAVTSSRPPIVATSEEISKNALKETADKRSAGNLIGRTTQQKYSEKKENEGQMTLQMAENNKKICEMVSRSLDQYEDDPENPELYDIFSNLLAIYDKHLVVEAKYRRRKK